VQNGERSEPKHFEDFALPNHIFSPFQARPVFTKDVCLQNGERSERKHFEDFALPNNIFTQSQTRGCVSAVRRASGRSLLKILLCQITFSLSSRRAYNTVRRAYSEPKDFEGFA